MAQEAGFTPQAVPPKILFPLLEGASFEDNEDLHTMWAALLANAASPGGQDAVKPGLIAILKKMSHDEAALLNWVFDEFLRFADHYENEPHQLLANREFVIDLDKGFQIAGFGTLHDDCAVSGRTQDHESSIDALTAHQLLSPSDEGGCH